MVTEPLKNVCGIVLAAGLSSRMGGFKPLLPLGDSTVLECAVDTLRDAGVADVVVVTGHRADEVRPVLEGLGVREAHNPDFRGGMYSSVRAGVGALPAGVDAFFLLPCDIPRPGVETVRLLADARAEAGDPSVCYPVFEGRRGHPPLISGRLVGEILGAEPASGLREVLGGHGAVHVPVEEEGVVRDLDTWGEYEVAHHEL